MLSKQHNNKPQGKIAKYYDKRREICCLLFFVIFHIFVLTKCMALFTIYSTELDVPLEVSPCFRTESPSHSRTESFQVVTHLRGRAGCEGSFSRRTTIVPNHNKPDRRNSDPNDADDLAHALTQWFAISIAVGLLMVGIGALVIGR